MKWSKKYSAMLLNISMLHSYPDAHALQRGGDARGGDLNRFSGFPVAVALHPVPETAKAVALPSARSITPLKRMGVRIILWFCIHFPFERSTAPPFP